MTTSGYKGIVFTEINPASTTTAITMAYHQFPNGEVPISTYILGPVTILPHTTPSTSPGTPTTPPDAFYSATLTETLTVTETIRTSSSTTGLSCKFRTVAIFFTLTTAWVMAPHVS